MIKFDYSFKVVEFKDLRRGDYFIFRQNDDCLYMKIGEVQIHHMLQLGREDNRPVYNCFDLGDRDLMHVSLDQKVIPCTVDVTVKPIR